VDIIYRFQYEVSFIDIYTTYEYIDISLLIKKDNVHLAAGEPVAAPQYHGLAGILLSRN